MTVRRTTVGLRYLNSRRRRAADVVFASLALVILGPLLAITALLVRIIDGSPVLFRQVRVGRDGEPFSLLKFRTMRTAGDPLAELLDGDARVTRLGGLLRRTSIDELPALLNAIRGDMSLVGPRPFLPVHVPLYADTHPDRLRVRPGVTGLAQVMGRTQLTFRQRLDLDVEFIRTARPSRDLDVILRTVGAVARSVLDPADREIAEVDDIGLADAIRRASRTASPAWEHGSFLQPHGPVGREQEQFVADPVQGVMFGTARQAFVALAQSAARVHLPSYFCPDVVEALRSAGVREVVTYVDHPLAGASTVVADAGDLVVVLPHFGRRTKVSVDGGRLLIDATHVFGRDDPADLCDAAARPADVCIASLRKTLPLPDGALVWTPRGGPLPEPPALLEAHAMAAKGLDAALDKKAELLRGQRSDKPEVLGEVVAAIHALERGTAPSAAIPETIERLRRFDLRARWAARDENLRAVVERLDARGALSTGRLKVLDAPFALVLLAATHAEREQLRTGLIARDVYPAVLWSQGHLAEGSPERVIGDRSLAIHVDARYRPADMERVADHIAAVLHEKGEAR